MQLTQEQSTEIRELLEDTLEYYCDQNRMSGELAWTVTECLATTKLAQFKGLID